MQQKSLTKEETANYLADIVEGRLGEFARFTPLSLACSGEQPNLFPLCLVEDGQVFRGPDNAVEKVLLLVRGPTGFLPMIWVQNTDSGGYPEPTPILQNGCYPEPRRIVSVTIGRFC